MLSGHHGYKMHQFISTLCMMFALCHSSQRSIFRAMFAEVNQHASPHQNFASMTAVNHYNDFLIPSKDVLNRQPNPNPNQDLNEFDVHCHHRTALTQNRSLVMINSATMDIELVKILWDHCDHKICADGGANRLFDGLSSIEVAQYIPGIIKVFWK
jgi:hypothetical protein